MLISTGGTEKNQLHQTTTVPCRCLAKDSASHVHMKWSYAGGDQTWQFKSNLPNLLTT